MIIVFQIGLTIKEETNRTWADMEEKYTVTGVQRTTVCAGR